MKDGKHVVLYVDDDPDFLDSVRVILEANGYVMAEAATAEEGLKVYRQCEPDFIIVDLMMEDVDTGSVVAKTLKDSGYNKPIWMLSSAGDTVRYNLDARELGLAGIFQKPIDPKMLVATLKAKLGDG